MMFKLENRGVFAMRPLLQWASVFCLGAALFMAASFATAQQKKRDTQPTAPVTIEEAGKLEAVINTSAGVIRIEFFPDKAPKHVLNFIKLAREGFYDGSAFHRMIANGIIQGGDPLLKNAATPRDKWGTGALNILPDEFSDLSHVRGTVSTVRIPGKSGSDGSQFFICAAPQPQLDGQYSVFGSVTEGLDVVQRISQTPTDARQLAVTPVKIASIKIEPRKEEPFLDASVDQLKREVLIRTNFGDITVELEPSLAPEHVRNFLKLVQTGWYDKTAFHRIIPGFVIAGRTLYYRAGAEGIQQIVGFEGSKANLIKHLTLEACCRWPVQTTPTQQRHRSLLFWRQLLILTISTPYSGE